MFPQNRKNKGFTMVELMIALTIMAIIVAAVIQIVIKSQQTKREAELINESRQSARVLMDMISEDVRSAGYGANALAGHTPIAYAGPYDLMINANLAPYPDNPAAPESPRAINPAANPLPGDGLFDGGGGTGFTDGAETIRYSFDSNNDGTVDANDLGDDLEERLSSRNQNLYCIVRQVFGFDSLQNSNGGTSFPVGLAVVGTSAQARPVFSYYYYDQTVNPPRDRLWGDLDGDSILSTDAEFAGVGVLTDANKLKNITKIGINIQVQTRVPDNKGQFVTTNLNTIVSISRNRPVMEGKTISGRVAIDANNNKAVETTELGVENVKVELSDGQQKYTDAGGNYSFNVAPKAYQVAVTLPEAACGATIGYMAQGSLDTIVDASSVNVTQNFPVKTYIPGFVQGYVFDDQDNDKTIDAGEEIAGASVVLTNSAKLVYTNSTGFYCMASIPTTDDAVCNPQAAIYTPVSPSNADTTITIAANATNTVNFIFRQAGKAYIGGKVFRDAAPLKTYEGGTLEPGIGNVIVAVYEGTAMEQPSWIKEDTTDADGNFLIEVPETDAANPYFVSEVDSAGWVSTTPNYKFIGAIAADDTLDTLHFGDIKLQAIEISAVNVMCIAVKDFYEYEGAATTHKYDEDIVLGTMYNSSGNILGWFDKCNGVSTTPLNGLFNTNPDYSRTTNIANANISAMASDTMDRIVVINNTGSSGTITDQNYKNSRTRRDLVIGLDNTGVSGPSYNVVVWPTINDDSTTGAWGRAQHPANIYNTTTTKFYLTAADPTYVVNSITTGDFGNDGFPDIVAGFSTGVNATSGGFVLWLNKAVPQVKNTTMQNRTFPAPPDTQKWMPSLNLGAVKAVASCYQMIGTKTDLVVGTKLGSGVGRIYVYEGQYTAPWFVLKDTYDPGGEVVALELIDINNDGKKDIVAAIKTAEGKGKLEVWKQGTDKRFGVEILSFREPNYTSLLNDGEPMAMDADFMKWSGSIYPHIVVGLKASSYIGKTLIFDCNGGVLVGLGTDPSQGAYTGEVAAVGIGDFNQDGVKDIAIAEKKDANTGHLVIFFPVIN